ncbi:hypothetical protein [Archangium lansingense]|uniref:Uncharacterized protein n=1 Tax=Archangium lansingense TaxID=2995310 RepID=A0ABT4AG41_9BACT|nr:hypothetical protein [Archangium lansinium]MCY1080286.1 hypothetical protein [Archangium lansinium]
MTTQSSSTPANTYTLGRIGYDAYGNHPSAHGPWTTFDGRSMPKWEEYSAAGPGSSGAFTQERWERAAAAVIAEHEGRQAGGLKRIGEFSIAVNTSEAEASMSRLEARAETLVASLREADTLMTKLEPPAPSATLANEGRIDPFLMGISEIASAIRDLAEATRAAGGDSAPVAELVEDVTKALHNRVRVLASPPSEHDAHA